MSGPPAVEGEKLGLVHDLRPRSDFPLISKVTVANYLRSGTERGLRTRAVRPRAGSASARRYWIVAQYHAGASRRRTARVCPRPPRSRSTTLPGPASWCPASPRLLDRPGSRSSCAYTPPAGGVYATSQTAGSHHGKVSVGPEAVQWLIRSFATDEAIRQAVLALREGQQKTV